MNELIYNQAHHIEYLLGTHFEVRMWNVYTGMSNTKRPPFLDEILTESSQMQALIILENTRDNPWEINLTHEEWVELYENVWQNDEAAKWEVFSSSFPDKIDRFQYDTLRYIERHHLSMLARKYRQDNLFDSRVINAPMRAVW